MHRNELAIEFIRFDRTTRECNYLWRRILEALTKRLCNYLIYLATAGRRYINVHFKPRAPVAEVLESGLFNRATLCPHCVHSKFDQLSSLFERNVMTIRDREQLLR